MLKHAHIMQEKGHEVFAVLQNDQKGNHSCVIDRFCDELGIARKSLIFPIATCIEEIDVIGSLDSIEAISHQIVSFNPDIVHSLQLNVAVELACRKLVIPHVMSIYPLSEGMFNIKWENVFPKYLIGDSEYYTRQWSDGIKAESRCIRVIHTLRQNSFSSHNRNHEYELVSIGSFISYKNQLEIIKAVEILRRAGYDVHVCFLGECSSDYGSLCKEYVHNHNMEDKISFEGFVARVDKYLNNADALVHASKRESYPGVIVEAMANRIPVLVSSVGGIPELVRNEENGILVDGFSANDIVKAFEIFKSMKKSGIIQKIIENGYDTFINNHTEDVVGYELEEFYKEMLNNSNDDVELESINVIKHKFCVNTRCHEKFSEFTLKHLWFLWHIKRVIDNNNLRNVLIWGAGNYGKYALEWCCYLGISIMGFVDMKKRGEYLDYPVSEPSDDILQAADVIFVAIDSMDSCRAISQKLEKLKRIRNQDFFLLSNHPCI